MRLAHVPRVGQCVVRHSHEAAVPMWSDLEPGTWASCLPVAGTGDCLDRTGASLILRKDGMSKTTIIGSVFGVLMLGVILYLSMGLSRYTCDVCITFNGRTQCRSASGADRQTALITARDNACAFLVASKTDGFLCGQTEPTRTTCTEP